MRILLLAALLILVATPRIAPAQQRRESHPNILWLSAEDLSPRLATDLPEGHRHRLDRPTEVVIYVPIQGASVAYTTDEGDGARWRLYTGLILVNESSLIRARAIRYGYAESEEASVLLEVGS